MGKANRLKNEKAENTLTSSTYKKNDKKGLPTWVGTAILITALVLFVLGATFFALNSAGTFNRMRVVMETDHFEVSVPMMSYTVYTAYQNEVATYEQMSEQWGVTLSVPTGSGGDKLDTSKPLREQIHATTDKDTKLPLETPETWFDYYAKKSMEEVRKMLVVCEAARAAGVKLEKGDKESIDMAIEYLGVYASAYGYTTNGYIAAMYGEGVNKRDVRKMMEISALADKYNKIRSEEFTNGVSDQQVLDEYNGNIAKYDVFVDYVTYTLTASFTASTKTDTAAAKQENIDNAAKYEAKKAKYQELAAELEKIAKENPTGYVAELQKALKKLFYEEELEAALAKKAAGVELSDAEKTTCLETAEKKAENAVANAVVKNGDSSASTMDTQFKAWVTDKNTPRKAGDVYKNVSKYDAFNEPEDKPEGETGNETVEKDYANSTSTFTVCLLNSGLKRNDGVLRSVAHILFKTETFQDEKTGNPLTSSEKFSGSMKTLADRVLAKHGKLTAELMSQGLLELMIEEDKLVEKTENGKTYYEMDTAVFEAYGKQYTEDSNVLYDNVKQGQMVKSFENWMFDSSRVVGEVTYPSAVETDYGYHIMLYRGDQKDAWSYTIRVSLAEGQYDAWLEQTLSTTARVERVHNLAYIAG